MVKVLRKLAVIEEEPVQVEHLTVHGLIGLDLNRRSKASDL
jgi:hypothetical protein